MINTKHFTYEFLPLASYDYLLLGFPGFIELDNEVNTN